MSPLVSLSDAAVASACARLSAFSTRWTSMAKSKSSKASRLALFTFTDSLVPTTMTTYCALASSRLYGTVVTVPQDPLSSCAREPDRPLIRTGLPAGRKLSSVAWASAAQSSALRMEDRLTAADGWLPPPAEPPPPEEEEEGGGEEEGEPEPARGGMEEPAWALRCSGVALFSLNIFDALFVAYSIAMVHICVVLAVVLAM